MSNANLSDDMLRLIGEYGSACRNGLGEVEITHRWQELVNGIKAQREPESGMALVTADDANNYCRILSLLGMEEEGDPVEEVRRLVEQAQPDADGWIEWHGGECPVPGVMTEVELRNGTRPPPRISEAWDWHHDGYPDNIVLYRVVRSAS